MTEQWRDSAACLNHPLTGVWDDRQEGELPLERDMRHLLARRICGQCPVRQACWDAVQPNDTGIRGGRLLPDDRACGVCNRPMVRAHITPPPGFIGHAAQGLCSQCYRARLKESA